MFDEYAKNLIEILPDLPGLDRVACRRALSTAYYYIVRTKLSLTQDEANIKDLILVQDLLHRLVDTLESIAIFDQLNGQDHQDEVKTACAFVAAEALFLLSEIPAQQLENIFDPLLSNTIYTEIESGLLYMVGGYDINATAITQRINLPIIEREVTNQLYLCRANNAKALLQRIISFLNGNVRKPRRNNDFIDPSPYPIIQTNPNDALHKTRANFYQRMGEAIDLYMDWLGGYNEDGLSNAVEKLEIVRTASQEVSQPVSTVFADIYHLTSLLLAAITKTSTRSLVHDVPLEDFTNNESVDEYFNYLKLRAQGDDSHPGHPFLWPSTIEFINNCMPGPRRDAVVSMPTGSGKGSIAELAIAQALRTGWVLYLAPTNALVNQIRHDLTHALSPFHQVKVRAFLGQKEYTTLAEEQLNLNEQNFVAVMTPEKCSLALRLFPEAFSTCSLCIFDECHLINDNDRGITADILLAQLSMLGHQMHFILMSAIVSNADELAAWLSSIHDKNAIPLTIKWRPSRTMRGLLLIDNNRFQQNYQSAKEILGNLPAWRVKQKFEAPLALIAGLSGPWTMDGSEDYRITNLPIEFPAYISRDHRQNFSLKTDGWKNSASKQLAELLSSVGMPTICFVLSSRHHTFSLADDVTAMIPGAIAEGENFPTIVEAWLAISDKELGKPTILRDLLHKGITVHSSAMLQTEQLASEWMFLHKKASLLFATGTLAQGLNLPAVAVVVAGTSIGDVRNRFSVENITNTERANANILNSFGRAGRPGFSNQGLAILVSDEPYYANISQSLDPSNALKRYKVLGEQDASIEVHSPVEAFIDNLIAGDLNPQEALPSELVLTSLLAEYNEEENHSGKILTRTFACFHKQLQLDQNISNIFRERFVTVKENYFVQPGLPDWLNKSAMISGVDFFRASKMWQAYNSYGLLEANIASGYNIEDWISLLFKVISALPPKQIRIYLPSAELKTVTVLTRMRDSIIDQENVDVIPWLIPNGWEELWNEIKSLVLLYMHGESYSTIAQQYLSLTENEINNKRSKGDFPIPASFGFINNVIDQLAIDAGCFAAIHQMAVRTDNNLPPVPETLQALPLCIRNGCDSLGSLAWFRFGYRQRICAHALQRNFQVPDELSSDSERSNWVQQTKRAWLANILTSDDPLVNYAKIVLTQTDETT